MLYTRNPSILEAGGSKVHHPQLYSELWMGWDVCPLFQERKEQAKSDKLSTQIRKAQILEQVFREKVDESQQSQS